MEPDEQDSFDQMVAAEVERQLAFFDEKLSVFFRRKWPERFGVDPTTLLPRENSSVIFECWQANEELKHQSKLEAAKMLLEHHGYTVTQSEHE